MSEHTGDVTFSPTLSKTERQEESPLNPEPPDRRVGIAVVGLGRIAMGQVIPGIMQSNHARLVAIVSGDATKAATVAQQYGIDSKHVYDYQHYDRIRDDASIDVVYIALPNSMHAEYTVRGAQAGKHVLCEKPMATSVADAERMIAACAAAKRQLMIAYRMQYEPHNREAMRMMRARELGSVKVIEMANGQDQGDPAHWRMHIALSGGGSLPDVGIYCLNTARFLLGEEPISVNAMTYKTPNDPRFVDIPEENIVFQMRFPSGVLVSATSGYGYHRAQRYRVLAEDGWVDLDPAFPYEGIRMRVARASGATERIEERVIGARQQFSLEIDHFAQCVRSNTRPYTPGEEGLQDMRIMAALYESAHDGGKPVTLPASGGLDAFRGAPPQDG